MKLRDAIETFHNYSSQEKIDFLVQFSHMLTILARDTYEIEKNGLTNPARLRAINEIQHKVTSFLIALMKDDSKRYPDDVFVKIVLEHPDDPDLQRQLYQAVDRLAGQPSTVA
jgi:hypothetical protein